MLKLNFDNLFIKHNWEYLGLYKYNTKQKTLQLSIIKQLNSHKLIGLYKEISYLRATSLRIDILERG